MLVLPRPSGLPHTETLRSHGRGRAAPARAQDGNMDLVAHERMDDLKSQIRPEAEVPRLLPLAIALLPPSEF